MADEGARRENMVASHLIKAVQQNEQLPFMKTKPFGSRSGEHVPAANIGAMRLPRDTDEAVALIRHAIDSGMRYIDTSRGYSDSEWKIGLALQDGYRDRVLLSTKWSPWITAVQPGDDASSGCVRRRIEESMRRLRVDFLDFYQVWNIGTPDHYAQAVAKGGMVEGILKARDEGLVRHLGLTSHDSPENLMRYIGEADWAEVILLTYNLLDTRYAPVLEAAHCKGIGTVVMNPVGGGRLAQESPVIQRLAGSVGAISGADLAIRYVRSNPSVDTLLCGMTRLSDVDDTLTSVGRGAFGPDALAEIDRVISGIRLKAGAFCTSCRYCQPCPAGIDIPAIMNLLSDARHWGWEQESRRRYLALNKPRAEACTRCGACEKKCTQKLGIMAALREAQALFEPAQAGT